MAKYDSAGFENVMPGTANVSHADSYAQGSGGAVPAAGGGELGTFPVSHLFETVQDPARLAMVPQGYGSTAGQANDPLVDPVSHTVTPASVAGHVTGPSHPNASK